MFSIESNFIHLRVFQRFGNLKSQRRVSLYIRIVERVLEGFHSCNLRFSKQIIIFLSFPRTSLEQMLSKSLNFFYFALQLCVFNHSCSCQMHQKSSNKKPCKFSPRFVGFLRIFSRSANTFHYAFFFFF